MFISEPQSDWGSFFFIGDKLDRPVTCITINSVNYWGESI